MIMVNQSMAMQILNIAACFPLHKPTFARTHIHALSNSAIAQQSSSIAISQQETSLLNALIGIQGRGRSASTLQSKKIADAVETLEAIQGIKNPTYSDLIEGRWQLMFTTRPGTASPIQRTFVGVDAFTVYQEIILQGTNDPRVSNIVKFSEAIGELKVEAAASIETEKRINFQFDRAAFSLKFLPFKVPYPVPFRLLGDEAKGWLDTTYLSPSGNIRISRGNKGTTFVLQKELDLRQRLLLAISAGKGVKEIIRELIATNPTKNSSDLKLLAGKWRLVWSSQSSEANVLQRATTNFPSWQIIKAGTGRLENLVEFLPGLRLRANARSDASSDQRRDVNIEGAAIELGSFKIPLNITGSGYTDILYLDEKIRVTLGNKGSTFVHVRDEM